MDREQELREQQAAAAAAQDEAKDEPVESGQEEPTADAAPSRESTLEAQVAELEQERDHLKEQLLRAAAETQNVLRRTRIDVHQAEQQATARVVTAVLPALDNFERTRKATASGASLEAVLQGLDSVEKQLRGALQQFGVERIESVGQPFNPELHEAVQTVESDEHPEDTVTEELEPGYRLGDRVARPALVCVAKKP